MLATKLKSGISSFFELWECQIHLYVGLDDEVSASLRGSLMMGLVCLKIGSYSGRCNKVF